MALTITGGHRVVRFNRIIGNPEVSARAAAKILRRLLVPYLRSVVPRRTGRMANSLSIRHRGASVILGGVFYARFNNVVELAIRWTEDNRALLAREIQAEIERQSGV